MIDALQIREILALYGKYGWRLQRVLLSDALREKVSVELGKDFAAAEIISSELDAAWFSRAARDGGETWELRHLSANPYALLEVFEADDDEEVRAETLLEIEQRMQENIGKRKKEGH